MGDFDCSNHVCLMQTEYSRSDRWTLGPKTDFDSTIMNYSNAAFQMSYQQTATDAGDRRWNA